MRLRLFRYGVSNLYVQNLKLLGKGSFWGRGQRVLLIIRLNTLVDVIRVPKVRTSGEYLLIDTNFVSILPDFFRGRFSPHSKAKANYLSGNPRKIGN